MQAEVAEELTAGMDQFQAPLVCKFLMEELVEVEQAGHLLNLQAILLVLQLIDTILLLMELTDLAAAAAELDGLDQVESTVLAMADRE
jgi:hypothetical protein